MFQTFPRYRDLWRFRAPLSAGEIRRTERWLATARVSLTLGAQFTFWMLPARQGTYSPWLYWLLTVYLVHSVVVMLLLRFRPQSTRAFRLVVHTADILWPVLISMFVTAQREPFFLFFVFVLAAAAYRWGQWETAGTAAAAVGLLWTANLLLHARLGSAADRYLPALQLPKLGLGVRVLDPQQLFMTSFYLMVLGLLLGYMAENEKKLRAERAVITRLLGQVRVEAGLTGTLQQILGEILSLYGGRRILGASQEAGSYRVYLSEIRSRGSEPLPLQWREAPQEHQGVYLPESTAAFSARRGENGYETVFLDPDGVRVRDADMPFVATLGEIEDFQSVLSVVFTFGRSWTGRVFLFDPQAAGNREEELHFLQEVSHQISPAVYNVYLMRRLRERAGAVERARFARELHDGAIQSLIAVEMQIDVLRRQAGQQAPAVNSELARIQQLLREEVLKLRELMQEMKSFEVDSDRLLGYLADTVERFRRETGISAEFVSELENVELPQKACRELARIVQESLVNVRKHSGAHNVLVRLSRRGGVLQLTVEDDGRGFPFTGRLSQPELEAAGKGPVVIRERVRLLPGELAIESNPGHGARLEIRIPPAPALKR